MSKYPFQPGDIVQTISTGRKGVIHTVGQFGHDTTALVRWFDDGTSEHVSITRLKKTLRGIDVGRDLDT